MTLQRQLLLIKRIRTHRKTEVVPSQCRGCRSRGLDVFIWEVLWILVCPIYIELWILPI